MPIVYLTALSFSPSCRRRKAIGFSPFSSLTPPLVFAPPFYLCFLISLSLKALFSPYKAKWGPFGRVATGIQVSNLVCLRTSGLRGNSVLSVPVEGFGEACGWWGRRRRRPGLRDQKDLLDQSCVCVIHALERSRFSFFPYSFSPGPPH